MQRVNELYRLKNCSSSVLFSPQRRQGTQKEFIVTLSEELIPLRRGASSSVDIFILSPKHIKRIK